MECEHAMLNKTILIIDDEDVILRVLTRKLHNKIKNILTASDGESGYNIYLQTKLDLIITDLYLPKMTGLDLINTIRITHKDNTTPIIVMSAYKSEYIKINPKDIYMYIQKPFLGAEVSDSIINLLESMNGR